MEEEEDFQDWNEFLREIKIVFSNKSKVADIKQKIELFKQEKKHIANFMIEFKVLAIKAKTDDLYVIFLLKKNIRSNIIKIILEYLLIAILETLKKQKVAITSVRQEYESMESQHNVKVIFRFSNIYECSFIFIDSFCFCFCFEKDGKPRYFNYNIYRHIAKDC